MSKYQQIAETGKANRFLGNIMSPEANLCGAGNPCALQEQPPTKSQCSDSWSHSTSSEEQQRLLPKCS